MKELILLYEFDEKSKEFKFPIIPNQYRYTEKLENLGFFLKNSVILN